ncbi:MAG TPA: nuclear transport factor 2 family protein [Hyphomonadaceae bacterium]|jgi:uncharacterized protein (TIGR02246 family)|nr:nuclear transport factor 2 family protein [Hyphomonadaceae bacterium]HPI50538.1 nuclear transport factor 2 family protein [Hyphomonadaceae bacterium]
MTTHTGSPQNLAEVRGVFDRWLKAVQTRNLDGVTDGHDDDIVMFDVADPPQLNGIDEYRDIWENFFPWFGAKGIFEPSELTITAGDDVAFSHCLVRCIGSTPSEVEKPIRLTLCYRKIDGEWLIVHEHHSVAWELED